MKNYNTINGKGYRYISEIPEIKKNGLPRGILNKKRSDVGGTYSVLSSKVNYIVVVPNVSLIDSIMADKNITYPIIAVKEGFIRSEFVQYIENNNIHKIIVTYDSFYKVADLLVEQDFNLKDYRVLVDEFHNILGNYGFRKRAIDNLIKTTERFNYVTYMSATPINNMFNPNFLKDEPHTIIEWDDLPKVKVSSLNHYNPIESVLKMIDKFLGVDGLIISQINGNPEKVEELFIYVNSVKDIATICKSLKVSSNNAKVVCSDKIWNERILKRVNLKISKINDPNKRLNFFTSKAFAGANLFSNNGLVIVLSNSDKRHTLIDLETSLYQIHGRLRENEQYQNVFRHILIHISASITANHPGLIVDNYKKKAQQEIDDKIAKSKHLISGFNKLSSKEKESLRKQFLSNSYFADYDEEKDSFELSELMINFAQYQANLLYNIYAEGVSVVSAYPKDRFEVSGHSALLFKNEVEIKLATTDNFRSLFEDYIKIKVKDSDAYLIERYEQEYPIFEKAYSQLGVFVLYNLKFSRTLIERYMEIYSSWSIDNYLSSLIDSDENNFISTKNLKQGFIKFLKRSRINTTGIGITASNIVNHAVGFEIELSQKRINGKRVRGYVIKKSSTHLLDIMGYTP
ncbi:DEAD/DEAH box helicase family protein [Lutibacter maritimus]|uniref:Uncharacterized protein n=1 Tax=Lutibacter maritimus TaxID=593133 RepID=A0A1I6REI0_9FLAO|nr:DEAD/DEAH box helicase family protein [Lutibacter maritimus]SFS63056.1 hypothetical protein SAMN04488006_2388 [Lutibacter maritimus]